VDGKPMSDDDLPAARNHLDTLTEVLTDPVQESAM